MSNTPPVLRGEEHGRVKLTTAQVLEIRRIYEGGGVGYRPLAAKYGIGPSQVRRIVKHERWAHL